MPFPLAHPAAVLPLRRFCPRWFNFPALIIGSLCPDIGYSFGRLHVARFSHRLVAGSFGFCLPVGLLLLFLFYLLRRPVAQRLPVRQRQIFEPLCSRPPSSPIVIILSLLVGTWTHIFLDSVTHVNGWLVEHFAILRVGLTVGSFQFQVHDLLYSFSTFVGVVWLAITYLNWLKRKAGTRDWILPGFKWSAALLLAVFALLLSVANHNLASWFMLVEIVILTGLLVALFFVVTGWAARPGPANESHSQPQQNAENFRIN